MDTTVLIVIGLVVVAVLAFLFLRKPAPKPVEPPADQKKLPAKPAEPEKTQPKAPGKAAETPSRDAAAKPDKAAEARAPKATAKPAAEPPVKKEPEAPKEPKPEAQAAPAAAQEAPVPKEAAAPAAQRTEAEAAPPAARVQPAKGAPTPIPPRKRDVEGLRKGLAKTRESEGFFGRLKALFSGRKELDPALVEQLEEVLLTSDVGVKTTELLLAEVREAVKKKQVTEPDRVWDLLRERIQKLVSAGGGGGLKLNAQPTVVMVVGVNGVGKTTTIGKLATRLQSHGKKVVLAAGDTFRAAAVQQLQAWGKRVGCEVVSGKDGANPGAVIFDAIQKAKEIGADVVLCDTAGRLHTKTNLMEELTKVARTMTKAIDGAPHETLLVLDATNGQNAMQQAAMFKEALPISGIVLTKLDGTAKGGIVIGISAEHSVPVRYIGIGERADDLRDFDPGEFAEALLGQGENTTEAAA